MSVFRDWHTDASASLRRYYDIHPARIPASWWRAAYIADDPPNVAANRVATQYVNRMRHGDRLRFLMRRQAGGRDLTEAEEREIRRSVRRKGR